MIDGQMYHRSGASTGRTVKISYFFVKKKFGNFKKKDTAASFSDAVPAVPAATPLEPVKTGNIPANADSELDVPAGNADHPLEPAKTGTANADSELDAPAGNADHPLEPPKTGTENADSEFHVPAGNADHPLEPAKTGTENADSEFHAPAENADPALGKFDFRFSLGSSSEVNMQVSPANADPLLDSTATADSEMYGLPVETASPLAVPGETKTSNLEPGAPFTSLCEGKTADLAPPAETGGANLKIADSEVDELEVNVPLPFRYPLLLNTPFVIHRSATSPFHI